MTARSSRPTKDSHERSSAEWITFGVSCTVVLAVALLIVTQLFTSHAPAQPVAHAPGPAKESGGMFHVPVEIENTGDDSAAEVQVSAELTIGGETESGDQTIDFLAGGETEGLTFVFADDPHAGELVVRVSSYRKP